MKSLLKREIVNLHTIEMVSEFDKDEFINQTKRILISYNCSFRFLRSDSKKNGHIKAKINRQTNEYTLELAINANDNWGGMVYTVFHELTHLMNNHLFDRNLSKKQAEIVADTTALYFVKYYGLFEEYKSSNVAQKWDVNNYSNFYIDNMQLSKKRYVNIIEQINTTKNKLIELYNCK